MFKDTRYFTVFGNAYASEHHAGYRFDVDPEARTHHFAAASWLVLSTLIVGISASAAQIAFHRRAFLTPDGNTPLPQTVSVR